MKEEEVIPRILAMEGRRGRPPNSERHQSGDGANGSRRRKGRPPNVANPLLAEGPSASEVKLLRKLEAQGERRKRKKKKATPLYTSPLCSTCQFSSDDHSSVTYYIETQFQISNVKSFNT